MNKYNISCPIKGYLQEVPHEDGELSDAILQAFDNADCGVLHDVDLYSFEEPWAVIGYYSFDVAATNEKEALEKASDVFTELWNNSEVDCGDLKDTDRIRFKDEKKEEFRCNGFEKVKEVER